MEPCPSCGQVIEKDSSFCGHCGAKLVRDTSGETSSAESAAFGGWLCQCGVRNDSDASFCFACGAQAPSSQEDTVGMPVSPGRSESWSCLQCGVVGDIDDDFCHACGRPRPRTTTRNGDAARHGAMPPVVPPVDNVGSRQPQATSPGDSLTSPLSPSTAGGQPPSATPASHVLNPRWPWVMAAVIAILAFGGVAAFAFLHHGDHAGSPVSAPATSATVQGEAGSPTTSATPTPASTPVVGNITGYATATASSTLAASGGNSYGASNLLDGDLTTCWAEGSPGYGLGEWIRFSFSQPLVLTKMKLMPGYMKRLDGWDRWWANGRLRRIELTFSDGHSREVEFPDREGWQVLRLDKVRASWIEVTISSAYPARPGPHAASDLCVSEAAFAGWPAAAQSK